MSKEELMKQQFGNNAEKYVKSKIHAKGLDLQYVVQQVEPRHNNRLLDIATGGGHVANLLAPLFKEVVALDLTEKMLENAKKFILGNGHDNVSFIVGHAEKLPFADKAFDTITCRIAAHHFTNPTRFIYEVNRTLEDDGLFILIDNVSPENNEYDTFYNFIEKSDPSHERALKKTEWITLLEKMVCKCSHASLSIKSLISTGGVTCWKYLCKSVKINRVYDENTKRNEGILSYSI